MTHAKAIIAKLKAGEQAIVSDDTLDEVWIADEEFCKTIRTARNARQIGTRDQYVAWTDDNATPRDLKFFEGYATATKDQQ